MLVCLALSLACALSAFAQSSSGTIRGSVLDPSGAVIAGATVTIQNPVSHYTRSATSDSQGKFEFSNIPYNNYHLTATAAGFQAGTQDVDVRSALPVELKVSLALGTEVQSVTVEAGEDLVENTSTTHTDVDRDLFDKLPLNQSSSVSSLLTQTAPGIAADSNGLVHGLGDHASNSYAVDGEQISDQQSKTFSNQLPVDAIQSMEVIEGAPPAEYGDKTSLVVVVTTRSGLGQTQPHGDVTASYGSFGSANGGFNLAYGGQSWGNFISASGLDTGRFLDGPEFSIMHDHGNEQNVFDRVDLKPSQADTLNLNLSFTRSWFQTPNSYDMQDVTAWNGLVAGNGGLGPNGQPVGSTDQRSQIDTFNIAPTWTRVAGTHAVVTFGGFVRRDGYHYYPSDNPFADFVPDLQSETIGQDRSLTDAGVRASVSYVKGIHNIKTGISLSDTIVTEKDALGIVNPAFNAPCLNPDGSPDVNSALNNPSLCGGSLTANPAFNSLLACYDLTRPGTLPASDGCPNSTPGRYNFYGHADIRELALFFQDAIAIKNWTFNLGLRFDYYDGIVTANQVEPRLGFGYHFKPTNTVLKASYARTLETPFNENLVLASEGCNDAVINSLMSIVQGYPCLNAPLRPGTRNEFHAGLEQAFGRFLVIDGEYIWKYTNRAYDFSVLGNTPITFPIEWDHSKIPGFAIRASVPEYHGFTAYVVMSSVAARFFTPQVSGIGATPEGSNVFRIDHDENFNETTHLQYQPWKKGPWFGFNWRYDSGLVAGPVPCIGGNCADGPNGSATEVDVSNLTPDQQFEAGLYCGSVHATPTMGISPNGLCPASLYGSNLVKIPAPGTENDDHNPPRIAPRSLFDMSVGEDNLFNGDKYKWSLRFAVVNLTDKYALYNFLSTFSGTHYVTPRALTATLGFHF